MATSSTISVKPLENAKETLLGMLTSIEQNYPCTPRIDHNTTLNTKFSSFAGVAPTNPRLIQYVMMGVGGRLNDDQNLSSAQYVLGTNMSLYMPRPFRAVAEESDLSAEERANYALRTVKTINGVRYALYYAKKIVYSQSQAQLIRTDPATGVSATYEFDYDNLSPTAPVADSNGVVSDVADSVSVVLPGTITITGTEVLESMAVIDGGDTRFANISEIGFIRASAQQVSATNANNVPFNYIEAIYAQMVDHYTWTGQPFISAEDTFTRTIQFSMRNTINT